MDYIDLSDEQSVEVGDEEEEENEDEDALL